jgi:hypothetical protein
MLGEYWVNVGKTTKKGWVNVGKTIKKMLG